jgi:hypothetical protein
MPPSVARLLFMHADRIMSKQSLCFGAVSGLFSPAAFDLHHLAKDNFALRKRFSTIR